MLSFMHLERMSSNTFNTWTRRLFEYAGGEFAECTHHSIRRACVKWAARCGASEHDIKRAGRWKHGSERFTQYWGDGQTSLEELTIMRTNNPNFVDPSTPCGGGSRSLSNRQVRVEGVLVNA